MGLVAKPDDCIKLTGNEVIDLKTHHIERCKCGCLFSYKYEVVKYAGTDMILNFSKQQGNITLTCPRCKNIITYTLISGGELVRSEGSCNIM